jgi:hypothetical protein
MRVFLTSNVGESSLLAENTSKKEFMSGAYAPGVFSFYIKQNIS